MKTMISTMTQVKEGSVADDFVLQAKELVETLSPEKVEAVRISELAQIVGKEAVEKFKFYEEINYGNVSVGIRILSFTDKVKVIKVFREIVDVPISDILTSLQDDKSYAYSMSLMNQDGVLGKWGSLRTVSKLKMNLGKIGCESCIDVWLPNTDFRRVNCDESELNYLETKIVTWL